MESWNIGSRRLTLHLGSITDLEVDAVVTAANAQLAGGGGVDGAVHHAAGPQLLRACQGLPADERGYRCPTGQARITPGFNLAEWVIHAVGPVYDPARRDRCARELASAYDMALFLADTRSCRSVAVPSISTGVYGYPMAAAAQVAVSRVCAFLLKDPSVGEVIFALRGDDAYQVYVEAVRNRPG